LNGNIPDSPADHGDVLGRSLDAWYLAQFPPDLRLDLLLAFFPLSLRLQSGIEGGPVDLTCAAGPESLYVKNGCDLRKGLDDFFALPEQRVSLVYGVVHRGLKTHEKLALVFRRDKFLADESGHIKTENENDYGQYKHRFPVFQAVSQDATIDVLRFSVGLLQSVSHSRQDQGAGTDSGSLPCGPYLQKPRGQHGRQGERDQQ